MMELADMRDLGSRAARRAGSSPVTRTTSEEANCTPLPPGRRKLHIRWLLLPFQIGGLTGGPPIWFMGTRQVCYEYSHHIRRSQLHSASAGAAKAAYSLAPSSFPNRRSHGGPPIWFMGNGSDLDCPGTPVSEIIPHGRKTAIALAVAVFPSGLPPRIGRPKTGSGDGVLLKRR